MTLMDERKGLYCKLISNFKYPATAALTQLTLTLLVFPSHPGAAKRKDDSDNVMQ